MEQLNRIKGISLPERLTFIDEWVFSERNRRLVKRKLIDGVTFEQIAEEFKLSVNQTKNIVYDVIDIMAENKISGK